MTTWRALIALALAALVGCSKAPPPPDPEIARLRTEVASLKEQLDLEVTEANRLRDIVLANTHPPYELIVTWPTKGGNDYRRPYQTAEACEAARRAVFAENDRREAENQAQVGTSQGGVRIVAVGTLPKASAVCLPS